MRIALILVSLVFEIHLYFIETQAKQHETNDDNALIPVENEEKIGEETLGGDSVREVVAQKGGTATLPCKVTDPVGGIVSWLRRRDRQLLTVGTTTHSVDNRFMIRSLSSDWALVIRRVTFEDAGLYECQIATYPIQQQFANLKIIEAYSIIPGGPDLHVKQGSSLRLECQLMAATEPPNFVFWYQQGRMINYDADPQVQVELTKNGSILKVEKTKLSHGGNYTCAPSNAKSSSVIIHVIEEEEKPAAMHGGDRRNPSPAILASNFLASFLAAVSWRIPSFSSLYPT
ncbi:neural cell adhesion molecule 2-like [Chelonus insularis]|uniref:neural cell adhesion molecule 2-like n=1 Tax=Chelonus insularis TaxID=460826 RepID=UPI00158F4FB3|nr:neural cell adhesion molecule 2-like [Chelonus insularis]XP_034951487.1 neural cell adhesion molecule 2-like [Chelonus insularis]